MLQQMVMIKTCGRERTKNDVSFFVSSYYLIKMAAN
jgi:hypothetical protein